MAITINGIGKPGAGSWSFDAGTFGVNNTPAPDSLYMMEMTSGAQVVNVGKDAGSHDSVVNTSDTSGTASTGNSYADFTPANLDTIEFATILGITAYPYSIMALFRLPVDPTLDAQVWTLSDVSEGNVEQGVYVGSNAKVLMRRRNTGANNKTFSNDDYADGNWHMVITTFVSSILAKISVDGGTYITDITSTAFAAGNDEFAIGVRNDASASNYMQGGIATLAAWKATELTQNNVTDIWADAWGYLGASSGGSVPIIQQHRRLIGVL